jgi:Peptidase family M28/PDZ domain
MKNIIFVVLLSLLSAVTSAQIVTANIRKHIKILANDSLLGRYTGSSGEKMAGAYIETVFKQLKLSPKGDGRTFFQSFPFKSGVHGSGKEGIGQNLIGFIDNKAENTIVIGAHYDHLGLGNEGNSLDANPHDKIHNGADDNASGTAGVLELARYFRGNGITEKNNFLFICFSGEELGLLGSKYFTEHPTIDLGRVNFMINMDMIGRLDPVRHNVTVSGTGTSAAWENLLKSLSSEKVRLKTDSSGMGPSDHSSFYLKEIPALHFFTNSHSDYHKPSDDWDKINYEGEADVLDVIIQVINSLDGQPKSTFLKTKNKDMSSGRSSFKVTMGIMPSYSGDVTGLKVDGVSDGKPAQKSGIKSGDVIIQMGEIAIKDINNYMEALGKFEKGQTVPVKVKRGEEIVTLNVTF